MERKTLKRIFEFLEEKEEHNPPFLWKWKNEISLTEKDLDIEGDLDLTYSNIESLPEGLKVSGDLILSYCENISSLPEGLIVRGNLILEDCIQLHSLPKGLKVGGDLNIYGTPLNEIENNDEIREMIKPGFIKGNIY
jgi:hypothetical protein